jgi:hypothetical protein
MLMVILAAAVVATPGLSEPPSATTPAAAPAATTADAAAAAEAAKAEAAKKFVCRIEPVTGTRFSHKVCRSKEEMAQKMADDQARIRQEQRTTGGNHY